MLTFDKPYPEESEKFDLKGLFGESRKLDVVECGENNAYWINFRRSTGNVELLSKRTGSRLVRCPVNEIETYVKLSPMQLGALRSASRHSAA